MDQVNEAGASGTTVAPMAADELRLGVSVMVTVQPGVRLRNNESGGYFEPGAATPQTVTVTTLARLRDGDLVLLGKPAV